MAARTWTSLLLLGVVLLAVPASMDADESPEALDAHVRVVNAAAKTPAGERRVVDRLSRELGVTASTLQVQRADLKVGWGELSIAYRLSRATGVPVGSLIGQHKTGMGWGAIARARGVSLGPIVSGAVKSTQGIERAEKSAKEKGDRAARAGAGSVEHGAKSDSGKTDKSNREGVGDSGTAEKSKGGEGAGAVAGGGGTGGGSGAGGGGGHSGGGGGAGAGGAGGGGGGGGGGGKGK